MSVGKNNTNSATRWLRKVAAGLDHARFQRAWIAASAEQSEQGFLAACYEQVARRAISDGEYFLAHDAATQGLRCAAAGKFPPHVLIVAKVTALARSGATIEASRVMAEFLADHEPDSGLCSAQARLLRDRALVVGEAPERQRLSKEAAHWAGRAKDLACTEGCDWAYPANQEAQFRFLAGDRGIARAGALAVIEFVTSGGDASSMWNQINLAEMHLVRGDLAAAGRHYRDAAEIGGPLAGDFAANRAVAEVLMRELAGEQEVDMGLLDEWFPKPVVVVFAGHIPDAQGRATPRLPEGMCRRGGVVASAIAERIRALKAVEGICASAPGGDILFAEALLATGVRLGLMDPFPRHRIEAVAKACGEDWPERLAAIFDAAARSEPIACAEDADEAAQCEYSTHVIIGAAMLRAKRINARLHALVLWNEDDADSPRRGGTGQFVALCRESGVPVGIVNPLKL